MTTQDLKGLLMQRKSANKAVLTTLGLLCLSGAGFSSARAADPADMIKACAPSVPKCTVDLHGKQYFLTKTLHVDPLRVTLRNGVLDASRLPDGQAAILISSDGYTHDSYDTAANSIDHIVLKGQPKADGIIFDNKDKSNIRAAALTLENIVVSDFRRGLTFGNHAYVFGISHAQIHNNQVGVYTMPHPEDAGERITFEDVNVFNNGIGVDDEGGMELDWLGCRWDYNGMSAIISGLFSFDGHIEISMPSQPTIRLHALVGQIAGALYMSPGSFIMVNKSDGRATSDYWVSSDSPYSVIQFPASTYGVKGRVSVVSGPAKVYGPALPAFTPN